jgi:hypothetical protein
MSRFSIAVLALSLLASEAQVWAADEKALQPIHLSVNTNADEEDPHLASNGLTLYYAANGKGKFDIMIAERKTKAAPWGAGVVLQDYIQTEAADRCPFVTVDGRYPQFLYYATRKDKESINFDLYVAVKQGPGKAFAEPTPVQIVDTEADEKDPWLTGDGRQLYFTRKTREGMRVFVSSRARATGPGGFGEPVLIKELPPDFSHATLTPDGRFMYLQGPLENDRWGLFVSTRGPKGWSQPEPLEQLNHPKGKRGDRSPGLSRDGLSLYFASDRPGGKGGFDLYVIATAQLKTRK